MKKIAVTSDGPTLDSMVDPRFGRAGGFVLVLTNGGAGVITWPTSCKGLPTTLTASGKDLLAFLVVDGGTTYDCTYKLDVK